MRPTEARPAGRPRDPELDRAILAAAEQQLREAGYAGMSLESVAAAAGTTAPAAQRRALAEGISAGELPDSADPDVLASMLIGSFYARYIATSDIPDDWAEQTLRHVWPDAHSAQPRIQAHPG